MIPYGIMEIEIYNHFLKIEILEILYSTFLFADTEMKYTIKAVKNLGLTTTKDRVVKEKYLEHPALYFM